MADFFEKQEEEQKQEEIKEQIEEKIKLGEKEYTQEELSQLVGLGERTREIEERYNTKIDRVWPEYTKTSQKAKELEAKIKEYEERNRRPAEMDETTISQAREAAKKIGIVTEDAFENYVGKYFRNYYMKERAAERLIEDCQKLEGTYDGKDGRPKFNTESILGYMQETGVRNPELAYKQRYERELDAWKERQLTQAKRGFVTETGVQSGKEPAKVQVNRDNLGDLITEALYGPKS